MQTWMVVETFREAMQTYAPDLLEKMQRLGTLEAELAAVKARAEEIISTHVAEESKKKPLPMGHLDRIATLKTLHYEGRELAIDELVTPLTRMTAGLRLVGQDRPTPRLRNAMP